MRVLICGACYFTTTIYRYLNMYQNANMFTTDKDDAIGFRIIKLIKHGNT